MEIVRGGMRVGIEPRLGAGLTGLWWRDRALLRPATTGVAWFNDLSCYLLAPWSNRIAGGGFAWRGARHRVTPDWPDGTAIHGLVKDRAWSVERASAGAAVLSCRVEPGELAWGFLVRVQYEVGEDALRTVLEVRNEGGSADPMPVGAGFHPFWLRSLDGGSDEAEMRIGGLRRYPCEGMIPTGAAAEDEVCRSLAAEMPVGAVTLDDVFAGSAHGAEILWRRSGVRVRYRCSDELGHTVVFTGMAGSFCLEPVTMVNDGFNLASRGEEGTGVRGLGRGESLRVEWTIEVGTM